MTVFKSKSKVKREIIKFFNSVKEGNINEVEMMLQKGKPDLLITSCDDGDWTALSWATFNGHFDIVKLLVKTNADVNTLDKHGRNPLYLSCNLSNNEKSLQITKFLIENKADVNQKTHDNSAALYLCALRGKPDVVKVLLNAKADILHTDNNRSAIEIAKTRCYKNIVDMIIDHGGHVLCDAAKNSNTMLCKKILDNNLADVNSINSKGWAPIHFAVKNGNDILAESLIEHNANINVTTNDGKTLLELAKISDNSKLIDMFSDNDMQITIFDTIYSVKAVKKMGRDGISKFSATQVTQCLNNDKLRKFIVNKYPNNVSTPIDTVHLALGIILMNKTQNTEKLRQGNWKDFDELIDIVIKEQDNAMEKRKLHKINQQIQEILDQIQAHKKFYINNGCTTIISTDEFNYRERTTRYENTFDEIIYYPSPPKNIPSISPQNNISTTTTVKKEPLINKRKQSIDRRSTNSSKKAVLKRSNNDNTDLFDLLDTAIAEAEEVLRKKKQ